MKSIILNEGYSGKLVTKAKGSYIFFKNKKLIDLSYGAGSLILGHNHKTFTKSVRSILKDNLSNYANPNISALNFSKKLTRIFKNYSGFIFCNSGADANMKALRIIRALSNKQKIALVSGSWHGSVDELLFIKKNSTFFKISSGLQTDKKNILILPYNDINKSKKIIEKNKKTLSGIIIEPIQAGLPIKNVEKYLKFLEKISKKNKIYLIFDEVLSAYRVEKKFAQNKFKIKPNISTFGKIFGGGMPIGLIGVDYKIQTKLNKLKKKIFFGGTFSANSFSTTIGLNNINFVDKNFENIFLRLIKKAKFFETSINKFLINNNIQALVYRHDTILRIIFSNKKILNKSQRDFLEINKRKKILSFKKFLFSKNIFYPANGILCLSDSLTKGQLNYCASIIKIGLKKYFKK